MSAPVTPNEIKACVPSPTGNQCDAFKKALIALPALLWKLINWMFDADGAVSDAFKSEIVRTGDLIFSASPNVSETDRLLCDGRVLNIADYTALGNLLGATYGGNGTSTFGLPDYRARFPVGAGRGTEVVDEVTVEIGDYAIGETGGEKEHTLVKAEIPDHTHLGVPTYTGTATPAIGAGTGWELTGTTGEQPETNDGAHENRPPFLACYIYIKT